MRRALRSVTMGILLCSLLWSGGTALGATVQLFQPEHGTVFFPDETIAIPLVVLLDGEEQLQTSTPTLHYEVVGYWGEVVGRGEAPLERTYALGGRVLLRPELPAGASGWYELRLELVDGARTFPVEQRDWVGGRGAITMAIVPEPAPGPHPGSFFGICEHALDDATAELMRRAGIRWLRIDVGWAGVQPQAGAPFRWARFDGIVETAARYGIEVLPIIDYTAPWAAQPTEKQGDPSRLPPREEAWRAFVRALVERYRGRVRAWEVWNEANIGFWQGTPAQYAALLRQAYEEIRAQDPAARVSIAGTSGVPLSWFEAVRAAGAGPFMDVVSVHPYRQPNPPEAGMVADLVRIQQWSESLPASGAGIRDRPLWITEMGYHTLGNDRAVSPREQARYLVRAMTMALAAGVDRFFWYEFADGWVDPADQEANFGLVYHNGMPKPAYAAYAVLARQLGEAEAARTLAFDARWRRAYAFDTPQGELVVAWSLNGPETVSWPALGQVSVTDVMGRTRQLAAGSDGRVSLTLTADPIYVRGLDVAAMASTGIASVSTDPLAIKGPPSAGSENLVPNGSFEMAAPGGRLPAGWSVHISRNAAFEWEYRREAADAAAGGAYLRLRNGTPLGPHVYGRIYRTVALEPWTTYTLVARVRTAQNKKAWIGGGPGWTVRFELPEDTGGAWQEVRGVFTTGANGEWEMMILLEDVDAQVDVDDVAIFTGYLH
ncbi:MAG TPA: hypothetical protein VF234_10450 [Limnochordia bacterium]